jgi:tetratricopeptide (TPR) repeat protein
LRHIKNFEKAYNIIVELDEKENVKGRTIYAFAEESRKDAQYDIALKAYQKVYDMGKQSPHSNNAMYYYVKTMEERLLNMNLEQDKIDSATLKKNYQNIINDYKKIIKERPKTDNSEQSKLSIAYIEYNIMQNSKNAIQMLNDVLETKLSGLYVMQATNELSNIYLAMGDIAKAEQLITDLLKQYARQKFGADIIQQYNIAKYNKAEILYYTGEIDSALAIYFELTETLEADIANDAIMRINFISNNKDLVKPLSLYSQAEYLTLQKKYKEALVHFYDVQKLAVGETLAELALIKAAELEVLLNNISTAKKLLTTYLTENIYPLYGDNALFALGNIAEKENETELAIDYYGELLYKYPRSLFISDARKKIRILRKDKTS